LEGGQQKVLAVEMMTAIALGYWPADILEELDGILGIVFTLAG
jgi:hypothetical protein